MAAVPQMELAADPSDIDSQRRAFRGRTIAQLSSDPSPGPRLVVPAIERRFYRR